MTTIGCVAMMSMTASPLNFEIVDADDGIIVALPDVIDAGFKFHEFIDVGGFSAAQSIWQTMRLRGRPRALPLAICSNDWSMRSLSKRPSRR